LIEKFTTDSNSKHLAFASSVVDWGQGITPLIAFLVSHVDVPDLLALLPTADLYVQDEVDVRHIGSPFTVTVGAHPAAAIARRD
jgi:hypothetical protein